MRRPLAKEHKCPYCNQWVVNGIFNWLGHTEHCVGIKPYPIMDITSEQAKILWKQSWEEYVKGIRTVEEYLDDLKQNMSPEFLKEWFKAMDEFIKNQQL